MKISVQSIESQCPVCLQSVAVPSCNANQQLACPHCENGFQLVPQRSESGEIEWSSLPLPIVQVCPLLFRVFYIGDQYVMSLFYSDENRESQMNADLPLLSKSLDLSKEILASKGSKAEVETQFLWAHVFMVTHVHEAKEIYIHYYLPKGKSFRKKKYAWEASSEMEATDLTHKIVNRFPNGHLLTQRKASFWESYSGAFKICACVFSFSLLYWTVGLFDPEFFSYEFGSSTNTRQEAKAKTLTHIVNIFIIAPAYFIPHWVWSILAFGIPVFAVIWASYRADHRMKVSEYVPSSQ